jgi:prolyl-tRNA synthetase
MLETYADFAVNEGAIPVIPGRKSTAEKFAGAAMSYTIEAMMGDTRALQSGTSHNLGQNFAKAFNIQYLDQSNVLQYCWTTSWGLSTRFIGAIIMTHGDDQGLILPPRLAPIQVVIVPIFRNDDEKVLVMEAVNRVGQSLKDFRVKIDERTELTPGFKFNDWELRGVPLRIEIGPKDVANASVVVARRDIAGKEGKSVVLQAILADEIKLKLDSIHAHLLEKAQQFRDDHIFDPQSYAELQKVVENGWAFSYWCGDPACELKVKEDTKATTRCIPLNQEKGSGKCIVCGKPATEKAYFARAY